MWAENVRFGTLQTVEIVIITSVFLQLVLLLTYIGYSLSFALKGMFWGNEQVAKRIRDFFLCVACIVLPVLSVFLLIDFKQSHLKLSSLPDL